MELDKPKAKDATDPDQAAQHGFVANQMAALKMRPDQKGLFYALVALAGLALLLLVLTIVGFTKASGWQTEYENLKSQDVHGQLKQAEQGREQAEAKVTDMEKKVEDERKKIHETLDQEKMIFDERLGTSESELKTVRVALAEETERAAVDVAKSKARADTADARHDAAAGELKRLKRQSGEEIDRLKRADQTLRKELKNAQTDRLAAREQAKQLGERNLSGVTAREQTAKLLAATREKVAALEQQVRQGETRIAALKKEQAAGIAGLKADNKRLRALAMDPSATKIAGNEGKLTDAQAKKVYVALSSELRAQRDKHWEKIALIETALQKLAGTRYQRSAEKLLVRERDAAAKPVYYAALAEMKKHRNDHAANLVVLTDALGNVRGSSYYAARLEKLIDGERRTKLSQDREAAAKSIYEAVAAQIQVNPDQHAENLQKLQEIVLQVKGTSWERSVSRLIAAEKRALR